MPKYTDLTDAIIPTESFCPAKRIKNNRVIQQQFQQRRIMSVSINSGYGDETG